MAKDECLSITPDFTFACPFCKECTVVVGETNDGRGVILHTEPVCEVFTVSEPSDFMRRARKRFKEVDPLLS